MSIGKWQFMVQRLIKWVSGCNIKYLPSFWEIFINLSRCFHTFHSKPFSNIKVPPLRMLLQLCPPLTICWCQFIPEWPQIPLKCALVQAILYSAVMQTFGGRGNIWDFTILDFPYIQLLLYYWSIMKHFRDIITARATWWCLQKMTYTHHQGGLVSLPPKKDKYHCQEH